MQAVASVNPLRAVVRFFVHGPGTPDTVPEFPLRCQHCDSAIRLTGVDHPAVRGWMEPIFSDADGHLVCDPRERVLHKPMPSVLG
jgi:hypothetical protein